MKKLLLMIAAMLTPHLVFAEEVRPKLSAAAKTVLAKGAFDESTYGGILGMSPNGSSLTLLVGYQTGETKFSAFHDQFSVTQREQSTGYTTSGEFKSGTTNLIMAGVDYELFSQPSGNHKLTESLRIILSKQESKIKAHADTGGAYNPDQYAYDIGTNAVNIHLGPQLSYSNDRGFRVSFGTGFRRPIYSSSSLSASPDFGRAEFKEKIGDVVDKSAKELALTADFEMGFVF